MKPTPICVDPRVISDMALENVRFAKENDRLKRKIAGTNAKNSQIKEL